MHSYLAKLEDISRDQAMRQANIMCFTETFLRPQQQLEDNHLPMHEQCMVFWLDRLQTSNEDLAKGGIMIVCPSSLQPLRINIQGPSQLEVVDTTACSTHSGCRMCILAVYRRPQQPPATFLSLFGNYLAILPNIVPTIIVGDFNEDLLSGSISSLILTTWTMMPRIYLFPYKHRYNTMSCI